jgi:putative transposase
LNAIAQSRSLPYGVVRRAQLVLMAADGANNQTIAEKLSLSAQSVCKWRPRSIPDEKVARLVRKTVGTKPQPSTHWTIRAMEKETPLSRPTIHRIWPAFGLQPHRRRPFKLSTDPFFVEKVRDIVGLYLRPPTNAVVLCVDEKGTSKPWIAPSRCCQWVSDTLRV